MPLGMKIVLTPDLKKSLEERGASDPYLFEARGSVRFRINATGTAKLTHSILKVPCQDVDSLVIVRNISRSGVGVISHQQWFPDQHIEITLESRIIRGRIARARRIAVSCYEIGVEIIEFEPKTSL